MDIVKRVDLSMNDKGKLNVFENPKGNYELIRTNLTKMNIRNHSEFALFLNKIFPINFRVEYVWFPEKKLVVKYNNVLFTEFFVELTDKSVAGYKKIYENDDNKYQIFYYVVDNPVNSISLLSKIIETVQVGLTKEQVKQMVTAVLPEVSEVDFYDKNNNDFLIKIPLNEELSQYKWNKFDIFVIRIHNSYVEFLGEYDYGSDESWENEHIETIKDKKHELDLYRQRIKRIEDKIEVMEYIQDQLLKCSLNFSKFEIEFTPIEPISLEVQDKIRRKEEGY